LAWFGRDMSGYKGLREGRGRVKEEGMSREFTGSRRYIKNIMKTKVIDIILIYTK
jgi:hypothetical protein